MSPAPDQILSTILKHDSKQTSYKIALLRAINDVVLNFPDLRNVGQDVAIPLRLLSEFWVAYYWPFMDSTHPILQGQRSQRGQQVTNDMAFRPALTTFRAQWEQLTGGLARPADGFWVINELRIPRKRQTYTALLPSYDTALREIAKALEKPIQHAGPGHWTVFAKPQRYRDLTGAIAVPGTQPNDKCLVITADLWQTFHQMSLWVEALCIHEWCLFTETVPQAQGIDRGQIYNLLTDRPDNRRPLTWERNNIDLLLMEGHAFTCPWTEKPIHQGIAYDLDHLVPISVYPVNELWNLVPADPDFNSHIKRDRLPSHSRLQQAQPYLELAYCQYGRSQLLAQALQNDVALRFATLHHFNLPFSGQVAHAVVDWVDSVATSRNLARF